MLGFLDRVRAQGNSREQGHQPGRPRVGVQEVHPGPVAEGRRLRIRFPIRAKITLPYLLLALFLAAAAALITTRVLFDSLEERYTNQLLEAGKLAATWMVGEEERLLETLRLLANMEGMAEAIQAQDAERLRALVYPVALNAGQDAVEVLDASGSTLISLRQADDQGEEVYRAVQGGRAFAGLRFVEHVLSRRVDDRGDKYAGLRTEAADTYFYVSGPVRDASGEVVGVLLVGDRLSDVARGIRLETLSQVTFYTPDGKPLATTLPEERPLPPEVAAEVYGAGSGERTYLRNLAIQDIEYSEVVSPWQVRGDETLGLMGVALPKSFIVRASRLTRMQVFGAATLAFLLVILVGTAVANRITGPLLAVVQAALEVARGNLQVQVPSRGDDEVAVLAEAFNQMVASLRQSKTAILQAYDSTLEGWSKALDMRDHETEGHSRRVTEMTVALARRLGVAEEDLVHIRRGALLHDIGKMAIPDSILLKTEPLSEEEWQVMRRHPEFAYELLNQIDFLRPALDIPYCHHERWDGSGYPRGLKGEEIPLAARIFAVVDVWDALTSHRPYRRALPREQALRYLRAQSGAHFDPRVVEAFLQVLEEEPELVDEPVPA